MLSNKFVRRIACFACVLLFVPFMLISVSAVTVTGMDGVEVTVDSNGSISESSGTVTVKVTGSFTTRKTTTITVKNTSGSTATISFNYSVDVHDSSVSTIDDLAGADSGSYSVLLTAGATKTFTMCSKRLTTSTTATAILSNFKVEAAAASSNVTVTYGNLGSVTIDGTAVASGSVNSINSDGGAKFVAAPVSGASFLGWVNEADHSVVSTDASFTYIPTEDTSLRAVFGKASEAPCFWAADKTYLFESLTAAINYANSASNKVIVLAHDGTLPSGDYTIPTGVSLLIPRDADYSLPTTEPATTEPTNFGTTPPAPTSFRKLTMANGANITVDGAISIAGTQWSGGHYVSVTGAAGFIHMNSGSSITVQSGGFLYAWGYITGSGSVTVKSGATVYEHFQIAGWRGGDMTSTMVNSNEYGVFPMSQYYVQNIEVPLTLESGATEWAYASAKITLIGIQPISVAFVGGSSSMFNIKSGYVVKDYIENEDRLEIKVYGDVALTPIEISMKLGVLGSVNLKSEEFDLPLNHNMSIHGVSGNMTINQDVVLLPGTQIIIDEGVTCTLGSGVSIYAYDADEWGGYCGSSNGTFLPVAHAPGRTYTRTASDLVDASICINGIIDASEGYLYTTAGSANVYSTGAGMVKTQAGTQTVTHQVVQAGEPSDSTYPEIPITSAKLKNTDGTYVQTETNSYYYINGFWHRQNGHSWNEDLVCSECGCIAVAQVIGVTNGYYMTLQEAVDNASSGIYIQMLNTTNESAVVIKSTIYLDLNGYNVNSAVTVDGGKLYGMDTATNDYGISDNYGTIKSVATTNNGAVAPYYQFDRLTDVTGKKYVTYTDSNNKMSFHRFDLGVTEYTLYGSGTTGAMIFYATFEGDAIVQEIMAKKGFQIGTYQNFATADEDKANALSAKTVDNVIIGYVMAGTLSGFNTDNGPGFDTEFDIHAISQSDAVSLSSANYTGQSGSAMSFQKALSTFYNSEATDVQKAAIKAFVDANEGKIELVS